MIRKGLGFLCCLIAVSVAGARELHWERISVELELTPRGDLRVVEHLGYVFDGAWNGGWRELPLAWVESYDGISVSEEGFGPYSRGSVAQRGGFVVEHRSDRVVVKWRSRNTTDPPYRNQRVDFVFRYTARGVVRYGPRMDTLRWNCVFPDRAGAIREAEAVLLLPAEIPADRIHARLATFSKNSSVAVLPDGTVRARALQLEPGDALQLQVLFPAGVLQRRFHPRQWVNRVGVFWLGLLFLVGGVTLHAVRFLRSGKDPDAPFRIAYLAGPPGDLDPALAGGLDGTVGMEEVLGTILDLARRGILKIEDTTESLLGILPLRKAEITRTARGDSLAPWERHVLWGLKITNVGDSISTTELRNDFHTTIPKFVKAVHRELLDRGWYVISPPTARLYQGAWTLLWFCIMVLAVLPALPLFPGLGVSVTAGLALLLLALLGKKTLFTGPSRAWSLPLLVLLALGVLWGLGWSPGALLGIRKPAIPLLGAAGAFVAGLVFIPFAPRRTPAGARIFEKVRAFRRYLQHLPDMGDL